MQDPQGDQAEELVVLHAHFDRPPAHVLVLRGSTWPWQDDSLTDAFAQALRAGLPLVVDLRALTHGDETLLGHLLDARAPRRLLLVGPLSPSFQQRLDRTGTTAAFDVFPTLTAALAALSPLFP